jgi:hypothetical protein
MLGVLICCEENKIMAIARSFAATAMFAGLALGLAPPASGVNEMSGHYIATETNPSSGKSTTTDWYFTPCGDGCASLAATLGGKAWGQTRLVNGQWTLDDTGNAVCPDGSKVLNVETTHYTWDANTLAGTAQVTDKWAVCGFAQPISFTNNLQLRRTT